MDFPNILIFDIETAPMLAYTWGLYDQNLALNNIKSDWHLLAWAAKWYGDSPEKVMYMDNRNSKNVQNDKELVTELLNLLDKADIVITQNGDKFDIKKVNARAAIHGLSPVSPFKSTDTLKESRKVFSFTSHSLEYMSNVLNKKYKKLKHEDYPGLNLWKAVLEGDKKAWATMKTYCINDVLATEELYTKIQGWIKTQNISCYFDDMQVRCRCGSTNVHKKGFVYINDSKFQGYKCNDCGKRPRGKINLLSLDKRKNLLK